MKGVRCGTAKAVPSRVPHSFAYFGNEWAALDLVKLLHGTAMHFQRPLL
jgi:hypothetical protein